MLRPHPRYIPLTYFVTHLRGLSRVLKERFQNERRMNSFWGTLCMLKNVDAAPSVPVHVRLGRYAGGSSYGSQSPPPPTGEDRGLANREDWRVPARKVTQESVAHLCLKCNGQSPRLQSSGDWHDVGGPSKEWMYNPDYAFPVSRYSNAGQASTCTESSLVAFRVLHSTLR